MKRCLLLLTLPLLIACGAKQSVAPTITPQLPTLAPAPATQPANQIPTEPAPAPTPTLIASAGVFPNPADYQWELFTSGLARPVDIQSARDGSGRLFFIEKMGTIRVYENGQLLAAPFLDITDRVNDKGNEMGLLGLAFHPDYAENGFFYVNYTGAGGHTRIARFHAAGNSADATSEKILLTVEQPYSNHNGGALAFGRDGYLYAGLGDGGSAGDPHKNGQNTKTLLGKILRIDVDNGDPYAIPADNPFGNEIWAYGLRNPWRISFDLATGDLWIGDVGQNTWEEVDYYPASGAPGANFGWSIMEGNHGYSDVPQPGLLLPAAEYIHSKGNCSITGGYVYRGALPEWNGIYLYGDYCSGRIWALMLSAGSWQNQLMFETGELLTTFGQDEAGEVYFASDRGSIYHLTKK
jgi:glucose/arabinose dehydrogenase